ncbi:MAG: hypothetical protein HOI50_04790 [Verrucomicrobia bacterium]|nr:hypothetical protein [Verrucomicrobiota bacterium]MBT5478428.1 hypothetical protein [Verrucomicrobiota bacterium]MBT6237648.1 hypothetical protein [Verrucomicrobiota bacterium]MBT7535239.1 hypothetical protein [Verrucomicrobiota bacterium]
MHSSKPLLLITGFLGAGKTTLLRSLLTDIVEYGFKTDVILNDFGDAEIDSATLDCTSLTSLAPLAAGCACCESLEELVVLCRTAAKGKGDFVLVELNGTADPLPLLETFTLLEERLPFFPRLQVCVIDARHWESRKDYNDLEQRQLETASFWYLSFQEEMNADHLDKIKKSVRAIAPNSSEVNIKQLLQIIVSGIERTRAESQAAEHYSHSKLSQTVEQISSGKKLKRTQDHEHQLAHRFTGCKIPLPPRVSASRMIRLMDKLPHWVLRAKALVSISGQAEPRWLFEKVGTETIPKPTPVHDLPNTPASLMCIGPKLDPDQLREIVESEFGTEQTPHEFQA